MIKFILDTPKGPKEFQNSRNLTQELAWLPPGEYKIYIVEEPKNACPCCGMVQEN